jgi:transmembrane sensor
MTDNQNTHWERIAAKLHGELSPEEEVEFNQIMLDNDNLLEFEKAKQIHEKLIKTVSISTNEKLKSWPKVENGIRTYKLKWIKEVIKYAAIIVVTFIAANLLKPSSHSDKEIRYSEIMVPYGQMGQLTLSDGTKIWLNSGTKLRYPDRFADTCRSVSIEGEAFFEVAKMPGKPFTINTNDMKVKVYGTSFNLSAYPEDKSISITLVEGKLLVENADGVCIGHVKPGQMATKSKNQPNLTIQNVQTGFYSTWIKGRIFFDDEPMDKIAAKLERWFNVEIIFADEHLKSRRFTGTILKNKPVDQIMQALELLSPIRFKHQINVTGKDKITIFKRI